MARVVRREIRKRGFFGWVFLILFLAFNAIMALWIVAGLIQVSKIETTSASEQVGTNIGTGIAMGALILLWALGSVILGLLAILMRGRKTIVEEISGPTEVGS